MIVPCYGCPNDIDIKDASPDKTVFFCSEICLQDYVNDSFNEQLDKWDAFKDNETL